MNSKTIGITSANGYRFLSFEERFGLFRKCGFGAVMLWWSDDDSDTRERRIALAAEYGLIVENVHSNMYDSNTLWLPGEEGERKTQEHISAITDCRRFGVDRMVMHLTNYDFPPDVSDTGIRRLDRIFNCAVKNNVTVAIENIRTYKHIFYVLENFKDEHIAFCYDSGHANIWCRDIDWLSAFSGRLAAIHLHDNKAAEDSHMVPATGTVAWRELMPRLGASSYTGCLTLETEYHGGADKDALEAFLIESYKSGLCLAGLL